LLRQDDYVKALIVTECWRQGKDFGNSQIALMVMGCLANRQRLGWGTWLDILKGVPKFSSTLELPNRDVFPDVWEPSFVKLLHSVDAVYEGSIPDPALGGIYWCDLRAGISGITNPWFRDKILNSPLHSACANQNSFTVFR
jgi:hypothetical protein